MKSLCPECGKKYIDIRRYKKDKACLYIHKRKTMTCPFPHVKIIKACFVKDDLEA